MEISNDAENNQEGQPHEALSFVLAYLPLFELLAMTQVCSSLRETLKNDILPWLNIIVEKPLNSRLSDDILMKITYKANGKLKTLALNGCQNITDDGLQDVIANNLNIIKLYIPSCTGLTPEGVIRAVKTLTGNSHSLTSLRRAVKTLTGNSHSLTSLRINGIHNMNKEHLETLRSLLGVNQQQQNFYPEYKHLTPKGEKDDSSIDVDICPKCNEVRMVFDCTKEKCMRKRVLVPGIQCRGCIRCVPRCEECGGCVELDEDCEAACSDLLCTKCWLQLPKCNYCNKPYCNQHANQQCTLPGSSSGFVCDSCYLKFISDLSI